MGSAREWKPGDVAMIEVGCHANRHRGMFLPGGWHYGDDKWVADDPAIVTARPLIVIDPEDAAQIERLSRGCVRLDDLCGHHCVLMQHAPGLTAQSHHCFCSECHGRRPISPSV